MPFALNLAYIGLLIVVSPILLYRCLVYGKYREGWSQKLWGRLPERKPGRPCVWLHAVSVGEVLQLRPVLGELESRLPDFDFLITTTTSSGQAVARTQYPHCHVCYFPLDFSWSVRRAVRRVQPAMIVLVELELWPNFVLAAKRERIPLVLINGRISERSYRGYARLRGLVRRLWGCFDAIAVQNETYFERLRDLGAPLDRVQVTGSIKYDRVETDRGNVRTTELRTCFGLRSDERVFIAGSTQAPEEEYALDTWLELRRDYPDLRLILVPRHKERFEDVAQLVEQRGCSLIRRTTGEVVRGANLEPPVLLLDTLGELAACWGLADIAFVGGSLTNRGGQNMIEPAAYGAAVLFGPNTQNFSEVVEELLSRQAARVVTGQADLTQTVRLLLEQPQAAREQGGAAQRFVLTQQGATAKTAAMIVEVLNRESRVSPKPVVRAA